MSTTSGAIRSLVEVEASAIVRRLLSGELSLAEVESALDERDRWLEDWQSLVPPALKLLGNPFNAAIRDSLVRSVVREGTSLALDLHPEVVAGPDRPDATRRVGTLAALLAILRVTERG